jgi:hypothetical protein
MTKHLSPEEQNRLKEIEAVIAPLKMERAVILNRARQRKFQSKK